MKTMISLLAGAAVVGLLFVQPAAAVDFTNSDPSARDIRDALLGGGGGAGAERSPGGGGAGGERRASLAVPFQVNSAQLTSSARHLVDVLAAAIMDPSLGNTQVRIEGHTDVTGNLNHNMQLSAQRAATVIVALVQRGVPAWRLSGVGRGPSQPLPNLSPSDPRNRRVDAAVISQ